MSKEIGLILDEKIPRSAVSERDGGGGRRLSYLEGHYVIDRLNKVFGHLNWNSEITDVRLLDTPKPSYLVKVRLFASTGTSSKYSEGYGYGSDKSSNNPHELAIKEAVTDALKVAAKNLGMSLGLALYDKTQENVDDDESDVGDITIPKPKGSGSKSVPAEIPKPAPVLPKAEPIRDIKPDESKEKLEETIRSYVKVGGAQKKLTSDQFKTYLKDTHSAEKLNQLTINQLNGTLAYLQAMTK